jgi:hypothetical protein
MRARNERRVTIVLHSRVTMAEWRPQARRAEHVVTIVRFRLRESPIPVLAERVPEPVVARAARRVESWR